MNNKYESFSVRMGYKQPKPIQRESMDEGLRNRLWTVFYENCQNQPPTLIGYEGDNHIIYSLIWKEFLPKPSDEYREYGSDENKKFVRVIFLYEVWTRVFDLIEFCCQKAADSRDFEDQCNEVLKKENSAYSIVRGYVIEITSAEEIQSIERAMSVPFEGVREHTHQALILLSDREDPDYRNSIKESISAVESLVKKVTGESNRGMSQLSQKLNLHPALGEALGKLYGFTSDADGIRHGGSGKLLEVDKSTARFMLVICSAFVNYIISKHPDSIKDE